MTRFLDICFSLIGILLFLPSFLVILIWIKVTSKGPFLYCQTRVGKDGKDFTLYKFRTMFVNAEKSGLLTIGGQDPRITQCGLFLRKYKIDELPQLANVLVGDMSFVGPRPEVRKYVALYSNEQKNVLNIKPGITDLASIAYKNENSLLALSADPEATYINVIMPDKIRLNMKYINDPSIINYLSITLKTLGQILRK